MEKSLIVTTIVDAVRDVSPNGGFVKKDPKTGVWYDVGDPLAREKIGQTIRDQLHSKYKSSTQAKKERRKARIAREGSAATKKAYQEKRSTNANQEEQLPERAPSSKVPRLSMDSKLRKRGTNGRRRKSLRLPEVGVGRRSAEASFGENPSTVGSNDQVELESLTQGHMRQDDDLLKMSLLPLEEDLAIDKLSGASRLQP